MSFHRHEMGLPLVLDRHIASGTSISYDLLLVTSSLRSRAPVISSGSVDVCVELVELVTHVQTTHHVVIAAQIQRPHDAGRLSHLHITAIAVDRRSLSFSVLIDRCLSVFLSCIVALCVFLNPAAHSPELARQAPASFFVVSPRILRIPSRVSPFQRSSLFRLRMVRMSSQPSY